MRRREEREREREREKERESTHRGASPRRSRRQRSEPFSARGTRIARGDNVETPIDMLTTNIDIYVVIHIRQP